MKKKTKILKTRIKRRRCSICEQLFDGVIICTWCGETKRVCADCWYDNYTWNSMEW